jgi:hypothetical protein
VTGRCGRCGLEIVRSAIVKHPDTDIPMHPACAALPVACEPSRLVVTPTYACFTPCRACGVIHRRHLR